MFSSLWMTMVRMTDSIRCAESIQPTPYPALCTERSMRRVQLHYLQWETPDSGISAISGNVKREPSSSSVHFRRALQR